MNESPLDPAELSPAQEESVRRLLADARATEPMPQDVRARLDDVLRELSLPSVPAARPASEGTVVDLAARRRSRAKNLLIAAAAVVAIGVAVPQVLQGGMSANEASSSADYDSGSDAGSGGGDRKLGGDAPAAESAPQDGMDAESAPTPSRASEFAADKDLPRLRPQAFAADAEALRDKFAGEVAALSDRAYRSTCLAKGEFDVLETTQIPVRYAKRDALLVLGPVINGSQRASVFVCGELEPRRTTLLDAR